MQNKEAELQRSSTVAQSEPGKSHARSRLAKIVIIQLVASILGVVAGGYAGFTLALLLFRVFPLQITSILAGFAAIVAFLALIIGGAKLGLVLAILAVQRIISPHIR